MKNAGLHIGHIICMACSKVMDCRRKKKTRVSLRHASGLGKPANGLKSPDSPALSKKRKNAGLHIGHIICMACHGLSQEKKKKGAKSQPPTCQPAVWASQ